MSSIDIVGIRSLIGNTTEKYKGVGNDKKMDEISVVYCTVVHPL
jgi:hypothetical protein